MSGHQLKEEQIYNRHYPKLCSILTDVDKLLPHFVQENVIDTDDVEEINVTVPSTKRHKVQKLLTYISSPLKGGNTRGFYTMLKIMKEHGNPDTQQLAKQIMNATVDDSGSGEKVTSLVPSNSKNFIVCKYPDSSYPFTNSIVMLYS